MKLVCLNGKLKDRTFSVPPEGLTIGRESTCELAFTDDTEMSRRHARIAFEGAVWKLTDLNSRNGLRVNGIKVPGSVVLADHDDVHIGRAHLLCETGVTGPGPVVSSSAAPAAVTAPPAVVMFKKDPLPAEDAGVVARSTPVDAGGRAAQAVEPTLVTAESPAPSLADVAAQVPASGRQPVPRLRLILILVLVLMVVGFGLLMVVRSIPSRPKAVAGTAAVGVAPAAAANELEVYFEKQDIGPGVLFRYELRIRNGQLQLLVDDVMNARRIEEKKELTKDQLEFLVSNLVTDAFLKLPPLAPERRADGLSRLRLVVCLGTRGNWVTAENIAAPAPLDAAVQTLMNFMQGEFGVLAEPMPREEAIKQAQEEYLNARRLFEERTVDPANLYRATRAYHQVVERLSKFENRPEWYATALAESEKVRNALDTELAKLLRDAAVLKSAGNLEEAKGQFEMVLAMVPDRDHEAAVQARQELLRVNQLLQGKQKRR